ncbi:GIY-YIG nuclease family protein [Nocardia takedensis]|uniref:GIY-YIG nuclease family protein n=1 Tax=Nocardia takedensis TaxID=259390 RepID=UPI000688BF7F|nr:GIY-YIG nuclease family protein [Nocardia takedensis]
MEDRLSLGPNDSEGRASAEFKLSITRALGDQLGEGLRRLAPAPLTAEYLKNEIQPRPGVYQLYVDGEFVYVGKASKNLRNRLEGHRRKLSGRLKISLRQVGFVCLYVDEDMDAAAPEKLLIKRYRANGEAPWNTMGFGNKDPGRNRDKTLVKAKHFDARYPINTELVVSGLAPGEQNLGPVLVAAKGALPYTFRFMTTPGTKAPHELLRGVPVTVPDINMSTAEFLRFVLESLSGDWQATALPGYVILYPGFEDLASATRYWRTENGTVRSYEGQGRLDEKGEVTERDEEDD